MNSTQFHTEIKNLFLDRQIDDLRLQAAEKVAFLTMAHFLDLPCAEMSGYFTTTSGTADYDLTDATTTPADAVVDRVTSADWNGSVSNPLMEVPIRTHQHSYYGLSASNRTGTPSTICLHQDQFHLSKAPAEVGTVYFTAQMVLTNIVDFPDNYLPLLAELVEMRLEESKEDSTVDTDRYYRRAKDLIKSFKDRMWPKKDIVEQSAHRAARIRNLNSLF